LFAFVPAAAALAQERPLDPHEIAGPGGATYRFPGQRARYVAVRMNYNSLGKVMAKVTYVSPGHVAVRVNYNSLGKGLPLEIKEIKVQ